MIVEANPSAGTCGQLHLYLPATPSGTVFPFVFGIHGGAWRRGDQRTYTFLPPIFNPSGIAVVLASYRRVPDAAFPTAFEDLRNTLDWLGRHGRAYGLDTSRCLLLGGSAGAHLAMLLATRWQESGLPGDMLRGVAAYCGIMDLTRQYHWDQEHGATMTSDFMGGCPSTFPDRYDAASPLNHAHPNMPPVWMMHGSADVTVPPFQSRLMAEKLAALGCEVHHHELTGVTHALMETGAAAPRLLLEDDLLDFCVECLHGENRSGSHTGPAERDLQSATAMPDVRPLGH